jgi:hypothetical protein
LQRSKHKGLSLAKTTEIMVDLATSAALPALVQTMPNVPPLLKAGVDLSVGLGQIEIAGKIAENLPSPANRIVKASVEIEGLALTLAAIPNLIAGLKSGFLSNPAMGQ